VVINNFSITKLLSNYLFNTRFILNIIMIFVFIIVSSSLFAQETAIKKNIARDDYFTIKTATDKVRKKYPFAEPAQLKESEKVNVFKNLTYASIGERELHLDIFQPNKIIGPLTTILMIHGGGWRSGDRSMEYPMAEQLAEKGYISVTVEYRLSPETLYPAAVYDLKAAVRWLRANAKKFNIDPGKIVAYGCSSGGHLATLLGVTNGRGNFEGEMGNLDYSSMVQGIVNVDGPLDLTHPEESFEIEDSSKSTSAAQWLGCTFKEKPELWMEASPMNYVTEETPPIAFINSSLEEYHVGRDHMIDKLKFYKIYYELNTITDSPHTIWLFHPWFKKTLEYVNKFLDKVFNDANGLLK